MTGGEALAKMLSVYETQIMFGIGGFQLLPFYDAISRQGNRNPRHILVNDERSGAYAADAYARVSGRPGLCDGTMGPGATNLTNGLIEAHGAGIPMVAFIGDSNRDHSFKNMTQETKQREVLSPIVKEFIMVERGHRIPELTRRAFLAATSGRPGPVILSVPENVAHGTWDFYEDQFHVHQASLEIPAFRIRPDSHILQKAAELISRSDRPVLLVGGGIHLSEAHRELCEFAESLNIPVAHTLSGKGCLPGNHPLCVHLFGRYDRIANELIRDSDLLIGLGFKFGEIATTRYSLIPSHIPIIHIDICPEEIGKHQAVEVGMWADCKLALKDLLDEMSEDLPEQKQKRKEFADQIFKMQAQWREANRERLFSEENPLTMGRVCTELSRAMPSDGILLADGGFAAHWTGLLYDTPEAGRTYIANRGNASIGYGIPGGMGAQLAAGQNPVVAITGDGGCNMSLGDLETIIRENIPVTVLVVNNAASGYVKALQHSMFKRYQSSDLLDMNYAAVFKSMGGRSVRVETPKALEGALKEGIAESAAPVLIDMVTTRDPEFMLPAADARTQK